MFIQLNENNEIIASASFKVDNTFIETDKEIVRNWDGKLVFEGEETERPQPTLDELKELKKQELKQKRDEYKINSGFSSFVFENLEFGLVDNIESEKEKWETFLKDLIKKYDEYKNQINNSSSKKELDLIIIEF